MGSVASYTFEELRKLDFGSYYGPQFKGTQIPSLDEFLELSKEADIEVMNIELKGPKNKSTDVVPVIIDAVKRHNLSDRLVLSGFDTYLLKAAKEYDSKVRTAYLYGMPHCDNYKNMPFPILHAKNIGCYALHPMSIFVNKSYVKSAHKEGLKVNVWTVNPEDRIKYMINCGVDGIIIPKNRAASVNATVAKASSGALMYSNIARVTNITKAIETLKANGIWVFGADMDGATASSTNLLGPIALVIGSEGQGISRLVKENCDGIISLPMFGKVNSLNASVAAGVLMYEVVRQRNL
jgi:tRNA(Leu) C34 or U34 (ribose-2'-O)-methylase TrmL